MGDQDELHGVKPKKQSISKKLKQEKKEEELLKKLERRQLLKEAAENSAKPVPKNIVSVFNKEVKGREYTVSLAIPGSILETQQTPELRSYLAGQIARAAAVFCIDEIVVFNDEAKQDAEAEQQQQHVEDDTNNRSSKRNRNVEQLSRILQYLECPQYLRRHFFPIHKDLQFAGILSPTDMPHHLRADEYDSLYREGVVSDWEMKEGQCLVKIGLKADCKVNMSLKPGLRVTVRLNDGHEFGCRPKGTIVSPSEPRTKAGLYWGYTVRVADDLSSVFTESQFKGGYDLTLGTSEKGTDVDECELPKFSHLLIVFGGVGGLEAALQYDEKLEADDPQELFDQYLNTCPTQGSRTIRSEEAVFISLSALRSKISKCQAPS